MNRAGGSRAGGVWVVLFFLAGRAWGLEGQLPAEVAGRNDSHLWSIGISGVSAAQIAQEISNWNMFKVTVAPELANVAVNDFQHDSRTALAIAEDLAARLGARAIAQGDGVLIAKRPAQGGANVVQPPNAIKPPAPNPLAGVPPALNPPAAPPVVPPAGAAPPSAAPPGKGGEGAPVLALSEKFEPRDCDTCNGFKVLKNIPGKFPGFRCPTCHGKGKLDRPVTYFGFEILGGYERCAGCNGTGSAQWVACDKCGASEHPGVIKSMAGYRLCETCRGLGQLPGLVCKYCDGKGCTRKPGR